MASVCLGGLRRAGKEPVLVHVAVMRKLLIAIHAMFAIAIEA